ncbi:MAG: DUF4033 domain-containing protein [Burkholderiaceae bacterium]|nr:MAG: DUF4033 domain-containing protein [Burkholderiaceae bacterium]
MAAPRWRNTSAGSSTNRWTAYWCRGVGVLLNNCHVMNAASCPWMCLNVCSIPRRRYERAAADSATSTRCRESTRGDRDGYSRQPAAFFRALR